MMRHSVFFIAAAVLSCSWSALTQAQDIGTLYGVKAAEGRIIVRTLDLASSREAQDKGALTQAPGERLMSVFQNADRGIGMLATATGTSAQYRAVVHMIGTPEHVMDAASWPVVPLRSSATLSSVLVLKSGQGLAFVGRQSGTPPFALAAVTLDGQRVDPLSVALNPRARYDRLTQCPNGTIFALVINPEWDERLVQVDLEGMQLIAVAKLQTESLGRFLLQDMACGPNGVLYALADIDRSGANTLLRIDAVSGRVVAIRKFDVDRMLFVR